MLQKNDSKPEYQQKSAIDYNSGRVNVSQILVDFKNTLAAIGAPEEVNEEVKGYLDLVEKQSTREQPSAKIIRSNLKNAAEILDEYITKTLKKPSKVVTNWVDALFLQKVDYKAQPAKVDAKPDVAEVKQKTIEERAVERPQEEPVKLSLVKTTEPSENKLVFPGKIQLQKPEEPIKPINLDIIKLKKLYKKTEKLVDEGKFEEAAFGYEKALKIAQKLNDKETETRIYMDLAFVHDVDNNLNAAVEYYQKALEGGEALGDKSMQAKAHFNAATIFDDLGQVEKALEHYYSALSLDGETENIQGQALTLNNIGNMHVLKQDYKPALNYYKIAYGLIKDQNDLEGQASILSNVAGVFRDIGLSQKALRYYGKAVDLDTQAGNLQGCAKTYELAGDIMVKKGQTQKAERLYKKSLMISQELNDRSWTARISQKISKSAI